jgi:hypothetical protein
LSINSRLVWNSPRPPQYEAHVPIGVHEAGIQLERASVLGDRFIEARLGLEYESLDEVSRSIVWIELEGFRHQFVGPLEFVLRVAAAAAGRQEREGQIGQGADVVGVGGERLITQTGNKLRERSLRFSGSPPGTGEQILRVGIRRRPAFETRGLDLG